MTTTSSRPNVPTEGLARSSLAELLLPDPELMGSPEGDTKGLRELQDAAQAQIDEQLEP